MKADVVFTHAYVLTMKGEGVGMIEDGAVAVKGNRIIKTGTHEEVMKVCQTEEEVDAKGKLIMPGLIDAHIHTGLAILRGVAQDITGWMEEGLWPFMKHVTDDDHLKGSMLNIIEGVKAGTTTFCDYDSNMNELAENYAEIGAKARVAEMVNEIPKDIGDLPAGELYPFDPAIGERKLQNNIKLMDKWHGAANGKVTCLFGPHGPDMMSLDLLKETKSLAEKYDTKLHMHVCQGDREILQMEKRYGKRSIPFLHEEGFLNDRLLAVHLTEATKKETEMVAASGASMVNCSGSIGIIDGIVPPVLEFTEAGGLAALGSDQAPGNNCNNMFNEMKFAAILNKVKRKDPAVFTATKALRMATIEAAQAIGLGHETGSLEEGKKADLVFIDLESPAMSPVISKPVRNIVPNLVYSANGSEVADVMVDGKFIMKDRQILTLNERAKIKEANEAAEGLSERAASQFTAQHSPLVAMMERGEL
ncbi:amidohydrolase family protein [Salipaludibacillus aurantiacus]|uniref:5-methylthioadenosine/S-adenosylhomocysteine deaminase n=1 Tax=Salipaludibacillus aurantiacus TaxID=1601833 RepID=A0A1H9V053_9BACI|nr:amidohydrolase family protein [Salipaludibacillus aurantiacus]SES14663.1 5-methylthioadenosine/S-adenosylhomocysteine deaminase [Salipaludibacillus aurantiacus]